MRNRSETVRLAEISEVRLVSPTRESTRFEFLLTTAAGPFLLRLPLAELKELLGRLGDAEPPGGRSPN